MVAIGRFTITMREADGEYNGPFSTFPEWHAFTWAVGYMATFIMALHINEVAAGLVLVQIVRVSIFAMTGKRVEFGGKKKSSRAGILPDRYLKQIRDESQYWWGGLTVCLSVALGADYLGYMNVVDRLADLAPGIVDTITDSMSNAE